MEGKKITLWRKRDIAFLCMFDVVEAPDGGFHAVFDDRQLRDLIDLLQQRLDEDDEATRNI